MNQRILNTACAIIGAIGLSLVAVAACEPDAPVSTPPVVESVTETVTEQVTAIPACTNEIADNGGVCIGEPPAFDPPAPIGSGDGMSTPAACEPGYTFAEDLSCVPNSYWAEEPVTEEPAIEHPTLVLPPCPFDEVTDVDCYWDAAIMGNGLGTSFVAIDGVAYYPEG